MLCLTNDRFHLASFTIDLIASIKLSKSKRFDLPYGGVISKVLTYFSVFPCASDHLAPQFGPYGQTTVAKSKSLKRKRSISSVNIPSSSTIPPPPPIPLPCAVLSHLEKMFEETREMVLSQVRNLKKEVAELKGSVSKIGVALTTLLKRTKDNNFVRIEAAAHVEGDAVQDDAKDDAEAEDEALVEKASTFGVVHMEFLDPGNEYLFTDLFGDGQNPLDKATAHIAPANPVPPAYLVDPVYPIDDDEDSKESHQQVLLLLCPS